MLVCVDYTGNMDIYLDTSTTAWDRWLGGGNRFTFRQDGASEMVCTKVRGETTPETVIAVSHVIKQSRPHKAARKRPWRYHNILPNITVRKLSVGTGIEVIKRGIVIFDWLDQLSPYSHRSTPVARTWTSGPLVLYSTNSSNDKREG